MVDELELISRLREEVPLGSADRAEHAFLTSLQRPGAAPGTPARHRRRAPVIIIAAATAAGLAAAGLTLLPGHTSLPGNTSLPGSTSSASPAAARLLARIAAAAAAQPNPRVRDGQFVYLKTWGAGSVCTFRTRASSPVPSPSYRYGAHVAGPLDCVPGKPAEVQYWYPVSSLCTTGAFLADGRMTKFSFKAASADPEHFPCSGYMNYPTYRFLQTLPTDPHALLKLIQQTDHYPKAGRPSLYWAFFTIGTLLYSGPPPLVTAALYRAAALIPGVTVVPDATDTIGRPGVAVAFTFQGIRTDWIFSKQTLQYLGSREINIANGALVSQQAIQQRAIVDHAGQIPG